MKGKFLSFTLLLATVLLFASCLDSDQDEVTYYNDTAITSFSLGTINQTKHTTKKNSDEDSTYTTTFDGSAYTLYIDHLNGKIYNADSLPCGADLSKVVVTVGTKNSGVPVMRTLKTKDEGGDTLKYVNSTDSLDFTSERVVYVYAQSMQSRRMYTVQLNVHKEVGDTMIWRAKEASADLAALGGMKAVTVGEKLFVAGEKDGKTIVYTTADGDTWNEVSGLKLAAADAYKGVVASESALYVYTSGKVMKSADGSSWTETASTAEITKLLGACRGHVYALGADRKIKVSDNDGATWADDAMEPNANLQLVPDEATSLNIVSLKTNADLYKLVLVGKSTADATATEKVWTKIVDASDASRSFEWTYLPQEDNRYVAPLLSNFTAFAYDGGIAALGGKGENGSSEEPFSQFYYSYDNGITWKSHSQMILPKNFKSECDADNFAVTADSANRIWIVSGTNGKVWCGRINRLGWKRQDTVK